MLSINTFMKEGITWNPNTTDTIMLSSINITMCVFYVKLIRWNSVKIAENS